MHTLIDIRIRAKVTGQTKAEMRRAIQQVADSFRARFPPTVPVGKVDSDDQHEPRVVSLRISEVC